MIELLGLHYTDRCNIECAHCCVSSGPKRRTKMDPAFAADVIRQAAELGVPAIKFTGGEALLYPREIRTLTALARAGGIRVGAVTNGYWAPTIEKGIRFLAPLVEAGLGEIDVSVDRWHWEYLAPDRVGRAIQAARTFSELKVVLYRVMKASERPDDETFYRELGLGMDDLLFESCNANDMIRQSARDARGRVLVRWTFVSREGRGSGLPAADTLLIPCGSIMDVRCPEVGRAPVLYPDGRLHACCTGAVPAPLQAGNLRETTLAAVQSSMDANPLLTFIAARGPKQLRDALGDRKQGLPLTCDSVCDMCKGMLSRVEEPVLQDAAGREWFRLLLMPLVGAQAPKC